MKKENSAKKTKPATSNTSANTWTPKRALPGEAREEHYEPGKTEPFGLNKRTRRNARGMRVTLPDGKFPE